MFFNHITKLLELLKLRTNGILRRVIYNPGGVFLIFEHSRNEIKDGKKYVTITDTVDTERRRDDAWRGKFELTNQQPRANPDKG